ncbi:glycosyltransferase family 2 protein [Thermodesulfobacteriota bacterium]
MAQVSIGLPVYNGEAFLCEAVDSILSQKFEDFELIISDNASTDRTEEICREYVNRDPRVRYYRNQSNIGAAINFNRTFELAAGKYFKWAAHDDLCEPDFLNKCVEVLDQESDVVLSYPRARVIDEEGNILHDYHFTLNGSSPKPHKRIFHQIRGHQCYEVFGLIRSSALEKTGLIGNYAGGDAVLLVQLCLLGRFHEIPEYLFFPRKHMRQSGTMQKNFRAFAAWFDPQKKDQIIFPYWRILREYIHSVHSAQLVPHERLLCYSCVGGWMLRRSRRLTTDLMTAAVPIFRKYSSNI